MTDPAVDAWDGVLGELEARLDRLAAAFEADEDPELDVFVPPTLPAMPPAFAERTRLLLERTEDLERRMSERRDELGRSLASLGRRRGSDDAPGSRFVDRAC